MTLNQLKYFCETCRCHSITAAANQLFVTQPAISLAIRELEAEFGITLFTRFNNRLTLTEDGALIPNATGRARPTHSSFRRVSAVLTAVLLTCTLEAESLFPRPFPVFSRFNPQ